MNDTTYHSADNAHYIFVQLLGKYKILLQSAKSPIANRKKHAAANALVEQYNNKCVRKTTVRKVFKKIANMKTRLKEKNFKNLKRRKKLEYLDWEEKFLDLWVGNGITVLPNNLKKSADHVQTEIITQDDIPSKLGQPDETYITSDVRTEYENNSHSIPDGKIKLENLTPEEGKIKTEVDDDFFQDGSQFSAVNSPHFSEASSEPEIQCGDDEDEDDKYEEQEAAAKAKKELKLYKLMSLRRKNGNAVG